MQREIDAYGVVFQSTLSMRRATRTHPHHSFVLHISIHALHEESDSQHFAKTRQLGISIHALHEESDSCATGPERPHQRFQSTLSMRRATWIRCGCVTVGIISIHALHEESDSPFLEFEFAAG